MQTEWAMAKAEDAQVDPRLMHKHTFNIGRWMKLLKRSPFQISRGSSSNLFPSWHRCSYHLSFHAHVCSSPFLAPWHNHLSIYLPTVNPLFLGPTPHTCPISGCSRGNTALFQSTDARKWEWVGENWKIKAFFPSSSFVLAQIFPLAFGKRSIWQVSSLSSLGMDSLVAPPTCPRKARF